MGHDFSKKFHKLRYVQLGGSNSPFFSPHEWPSFRRPPPPPPGQLRPPKTFCGGEIAEVTDLELEAYKTGGPPPPNARAWDIPREAGIAPVGRSWQNRQWRSMYREQYRTVTANVARGMVEEEGNLVKFHVTTDAAQAAYYYVEGKRAAWEAEEFHWLEELLREQEDAPGAEAQAQKGHAADQLSRKRATQAEKGNAADHPSGEKATQAEKGHAGDKATQGSGGSMPKLWSEPDAARKKAPRSSVGQPIVGDESDTDNVEEWLEESDTIAHRIREGRCRERTPEPDPVERQEAREEARRKMEARKAEDKKIFDGLQRRYKRQAAENEANFMARIRETEQEQVVRLSARWVENVANFRAPSSAQRNRQLQSSNTAPDKFWERRRTPRSLQGAPRRAGWVPAGQLPDYPQAYHSPRDEGALDPSRPSRHSYVVAVEREDEETWNSGSAAPAVGAGPRSELPARRIHGACRGGALAGEGGPEAELLLCGGESRHAFMYRPTDEWKIPEPGDLIDKGKSMMEQHREV